LAAHATEQVRAASGVPRMGEDRAMHAYMHMKESKSPPADAVWLCCMLLMRPNSTDIHLDAFHPDDLIVSPTT
jgi:hypothetical protein